MTDFRDEIQDHALEERLATVAVYADGRAFAAVHTAVPWAEFDLSGLAASVEKGGHA